MKAADGSRRTVLIALAVLLTVAFGAIAGLSFRFAPDSTPMQRPVLATLAWLAIAFAAYLAAIFVALRSKEDRWLLAIVVLASVLFRAVSIYSWPILEVDIYRYLWDGSVAMEGVSPYRYSPQQVLAAAPQSELPEDLDRLAQLRYGSPAAATILSRVHYGELTTIYPPVSQAVFAAATRLTPSSAGVLDRIVIMKTAFVLFDLATLAVVIALLRLTGKHVGWSVAYGWCPLVIKEIANTGHLDSVAVFLVVWALYFALRPLPDAKSRASGGKSVAVSAALLALAVGAKLYPVVLFPLFAAVWGRMLGWRRMSAAVLASGVTASVLLWPMVPLQEAPPADGLTAFLRRWEMNDFLFLLVVENLKPPADAKPDQQTWFAIVPEAWRARLLKIPSRWCPSDPSRAAFFSARFVTSLAFLIILAVLVGRASLSTDPTTWLRVAFLALAWFWLLSPTQNPWYWIWALPLVMFARGKAWLALSGLTMVYYVRFWLTYHWSDQPVFGTRYCGAAFFDLVVTWLEYGPCFVLLGVESWRRRGAAPDVLVKSA